MKNKPLKVKFFYSYGIIFFFVLLLGLSSISVTNMMTNQTIKYSEKILPAVEQIGFVKEI